MRKLQLLASAFALAAVAPQAAIAAGPVLDPSVQKFVDRLAGGKPIYDVSPADARKVLVGLQSVPEVMPAVQTEDRVLLLGPKGSTKIRVIRPKGVTGTLPVIVYFHGAGWVMVDTQTHDRLVRELSAVRGDGDGSALRTWLVSMAAAAFVCAIAADAMGDAAAYMAESSEIRPRLAFTKRICSAVGPGMMLRMSFLGLATHRSMLPRPSRSLGRNPPAR